MNLMPAAPYSMPFDPTQAYWGAYNNMAYGTPVATHPGNYFSPKSDSCSTSEDSSPNGGKKTDRVFGSEEEKRQYYAKRARNNEAAKKSRITRKDRESRLQHENNRLKEKLKEQEKMVEMLTQKNNYLNVQLQQLWTNQTADVSGSSQGVHGVPVNHGHMIKNDENVPPLNMQFNPFSSQM